MKRNMRTRQQMPQEFNKGDGLLSFTIKKNTKDKSFIQISFLDWNDNLIKRLISIKESKKIIRSTIEQMKLVKRINDGIYLLFLSRKKGYYKYILITKSQLNSQSLGGRLDDSISQLWTENKIKSEISKPVSKINDDSVVNQTSLYYSLRGGGCGVSKAQNEIAKLQSTFYNQRQFPFNFLTDLNKYLDIIISKAQFASDQQQKEEILIALQWFICMKEHFNSLCQDSQSASSVYDLIFKSVPLLLKSLVTYIRISGFLCLQVLQIINDLCRILFTYYMKNQKRYMDIKDKDQLDLLVQDFETQLDIESQNIWVGGAEFELAMIKAVIQSSPNNSDEGKKLLTTFLGGLVQSVLTMSPSEDLIDSLINGVKYLYKENQVRNLKRNYEVYYYFESLKWYIIELLRQDVQPQKVLKLLQKAFFNYIENKKEWLLNFCWVKFMADIISYRPIISKYQLPSNNAIEQQKNWNQLIKYKYINQCSFNKNLGRLILFPDLQNQETLQLNYLMKRIGQHQFQEFNELLLNTLNYSSINLFIFDKKIEKEGNKVNILLGLFQENSVLAESIENLNNQKIGLIQLFEKIKEEFQSIKKEKDVKQRNLSIDQIVEITQDFIKQCFYTLNVSSYIQQTYQIYFERAKLILNSIEQDSTTKKEIKDVQKVFIERCEQMTLMKQDQQLDLINLLVTVEVAFVSKLFEENTFLLLTKKDGLIANFFNSIDQFLKPFVDILEKLSIIYQKYCNEPKASNFNYNESVELSTLEIIGEKLLTQFNYFDQIQLVFQLFQTEEDKQQKHNTQLIIQRKTRYFLMDLINKMQIQKETINNILIFLQKSKCSLTISSNEEKSDNQTEQGIEEIISDQIQFIQQFFDEEGKQTESEKIVLAEKLTNILRRGSEKILEKQQSHPNGQILQNIRYLTAIVQQYLNLYIQKPQGINIIKDQILQIYQEIKEKWLKQKSEFQTIKKDQDQSQNQNCQILSKMMEQFQNFNNSIESLIFLCQKILDVIQDRFKLNEGLQIIQEELNVQENDQQKYTYLYEKNSNLFLQEYLNKLKEQQLQLVIKLQEQQQSKGRFLYLLLQFCDILRPNFIITINVDQNIIKKTLGQIKNVFEETKGILEDENYKARQCYAISLTSIQSLSYEKNLIQFTQDCLVQVWATEKDERVKLFLKNQEFLDMQKSLFSSDLKSFSKRLQQKMQERLNKINDLEQAIYLEGDCSIRQQIQQELQQQHVEFEDYLDNINDMSSKLDIGLYFLKDIQRSLTLLKQKIDKLQDTINEIGDDIRKLRGKTFTELLNIRKRKVLEQMQLSSLNQIYIPLKCQEWDPISGQKIEDSSDLLQEIFENKKGEINEFLHKDQSQKDVLLLRGVAGAGKSRAARKIEEFLWQKTDSKDSTWIPIYVSLPSIKEPKFNLIDQALESDFYQFDKIQVKEFKEEIEQENLKIILILDSYDEMKQECLQSNLYQTNRFQKGLFGNIQDTQRVKEYLKIIITTRTEILTSSSYQTWFYGESIQSLKEVELLGFDEKQQQEYLEEYVLMNMKKQFLEIYTFLKSVQKEKNSYEKFCFFWKKIFDFIEKNITNQFIQNDMMINEKQAKQIVNLLKQESIFQKLNRDQIVNLQKQLMNLWSSNKFSKLIISAQIQHILTTPFLMEIVVQVLPSMTRKYSDASSFKDQIIQNYISIKQKNQIEQQLIQKYRNQRLLEKGLPEILDSNDQLTGEILKQRALNIWDQLQNFNFFQKFSLVDKITKNDLSTIDDANIVVRALIVKQLTVFDFYIKFIEFYHSQQIKKQLEQGRVINYESFMIDLFNFSQSLALNLTIKEMTQIKYIQKGQLILSYVNQQSEIAEDWMDAYFDDFEQNGDYKKLIRSCILLTQKGGNYSFTHKSIQEFYVGHFLLLWLEEIKIIEQEEFKSQIQTLNIENILQKQKNSEQKIILSQIEQFGLMTLNSLTNNDQFNLSSVNYKGTLSLIKDEMKLKPDLKQKLIQVVKLSKSSHLFTRASSNSLYLLGYNHEFLGNLDFSKIKISDIQLGSVSFYQSDLENSEFTNVSISSCNFNKSNLKNAQWENIQCDELHSLKQGNTQALAFFSNGQSLVSTHSDYIQFQNIQDGEVTLTLNTKQYCSVQFLDALKVTNIILSPNEQLLAIQRHAITVYQDVQGSMFDIQLINIKTGKFVEVKPFGYADDEFIFSQDSTILASCTQTKKDIQLFNISDSQVSLLTGHQQQVRSILFTFDNQNLISCSHDTHIILWDFREKKILAQLKGHQFSYTALSLSMNGCTLASCSKNTIKLWNIQTKEHIFDLEGHKKDIRNLKFLLDKKTLVSWGEDKLILIWDISLGKKLKCIERRYQKYQSPVCFSSDNQIMAFQNENEIELWDIYVGKKIKAIGGQSKNITALNFQPTGQNKSEILVSVLERGIIQLWDTKIKVQNIQLDGHKTAVTWVQFSPDGLLVFSCGCDKIIRIWDSQEGKQLNSIYFEYYGEDSNIMSSNQGEFLLFWSFQLGIWYFKENKLITINLEDQKKSYTIQSMKILGNLLGLCFQVGNEVKIFDLQFGKLARVIEVNEGIKDIFISPDGNWLSSLGKYDTKAYFLDLKTYELRFILEQIIDIIFSPDSKIICVETKQGWFRLFNLQGILIAQFDFGKQIKFSPNSKILASIFQDQIILINSENGKSLIILKGHLEKITQYEFSPDGLIIASIDGINKNIYLWDVQQCKLLRILEGHKSNIKGITFSFNGELLASYCEQSQLILWNYREGKQIKTLEEHQERIQCVLFSPNDKVFVSSDYCYLVIVWDVESWNKITSYRTKDQLSRFTFSFDSKLLCFLIDEKTIGVLNYTVDENIIQLRGHQERIEKIIFTLDNLALISYSYHENMVLLWDIQNFQIKNILHKEKTKFAKVLLSNDDSKFVINQRDQYIRVYDPESGKLLVTFEGHKHVIQDIALSSDCKKLASCSYDFTIKIWDMEKLQENAVLSFDYLIKQVDTFQFSPDNCYLIIREKDYKDYYGIRFWDIHKQQFTNQYFKTRFIKYSPNKIHFAYSDDKKIHVWNYTQQSSYFEYEFGYGIQPDSIQFGCHGKWLIYLEYDSSPIVIWYFVILDIAQKELFRKIQITNGELKFKFMLDWKVLVLTEQNNIKFRDIQDELEVAVFQEHTDSINEFDISPDNLVMISGSKDTTIKLTSLKDILSNGKSKKNPIILSSYKTMALYTPMTAIDCNIQGANIKSNRDWYMKELFLQKGAIEKDD